MKRAERSRKTTRGKPEGQKRGGGGGGMFHVLGFFPWTFVSHLVLHLPLMDRKRAKKKKKKRRSLGVILVKFNHRTQELTRWEILEGNRSNESYRRGKDLRAKTNKFDTDGGESPAWEGPVSAHETYRLNLTRPRTQRSRAETCRVFWNRSLSVCLDCIWIPITVQNSQSLACVRACVRVCASRSGSVFAFNIVCCPFKRPVFQFYRLFWQKRVSIPHEMWSGSKKSVSQSPEERKRLMQRSRGDTTTYRQHRIVWQLRVSYWITVSGSLVFVPYTSWGWGV